MLRGPPGSTSSLELVILEDGSPALDKCQSGGLGCDVYGVTREDTEARGLQSALWVDDWLTLS